MSTTIWTAVVAQLMALLVLGAAALPVNAQTGSDSGASFGLDAAAQPGGATVDLSAQADPAGEPETEQTTMKASPEATVGSTLETPAQPAPAIAPAPAQPTVGSTPTVSQYQHGSLADTGGVSPNRPLKLGAILALGLAALAMVNRRALRPTTNRKDEDVYFG